MPFHCSFKLQVLGSSLDNSSKLSKCSYATEIKCLSVYSLTSWLHSNGEMQTFLLMISRLRLDRFWLNIVEISWWSFDPVIFPWKGITDQTSTGYPTLGPLICVYIWVGLSVFNSFKIHLSKCWLYTVVDKRLNCKHINCSVNMLQCRLTNRNKHAWVSLAVQFVALKYILLVTCGLQSHTSVFVSQRCTILVLV